MPKVAGHIKVKKAAQYDFDSQKREKQQTLANRRQRHGGEKALRRHVEGVGGAE